MRLRTGLLTHSGKSRASLGYPASHREKSHLTKKDMHVVSLIWNTMKLPPNVCHSVPVLMVTFLSKDFNISGVYFKS